MIEALNNELNSTWQLLKKKNKSQESIQAIERCIMNTKTKMDKPDNIFYLEEFISSFSLLIDLKSASWVNLGLNYLLKVLHLQPINDTKEMKQLVFTLEKIKAEPDDEVNLKYLQVFQHICNKSIIQMADLDIVKTITECFYIQMTKKNPIGKSITSALIIQTNQIIFNELVRLLDLETDKKPSSMSDFKNYSNNDLQNFREIVKWVLEVALSIIDEKGPRWILKNDETCYSLAFDTILTGIECLEGRLLEDESLRQIVGKDFVFYLQINMRKLKDLNESETAIKLFRGLFLLVKKLQIGHIILLDCFTFLKVKKYNLFTFLTLTVYSRLLLDKNCLLDIHQFLAGQKKYYEVDNTFKTISTSLTKRIQNYEVYIEPPIKYSKVFDITSKIDKSTPITDMNTAQSFFELIGNLFECLYKTAESYGMDLKIVQIEKSINPEFKTILSEYSDTVLMCYDLIGSNIMGDYYLNTRNTNIQKMLKLSLYYDLEELSQKIIGFIAKECLFQMNSSDETIQKVMMTSKIAINIGQCLPELQTSATWFSILEFLETLNCNLKRFQKNMTTPDKNQLNGVKINHKSQTTFNSDVSLTLSSIKNLFQLSSNFSDTQIVNLVGSVVKILTEHLDLRSKKKTKEGLFSENECICQDNLALIWKANDWRINKILPQLKHIMSIYLLHPQRQVNETGIKFLVDLVKSLVESENQKSLQHQKDLLLSVISYTDNDRNAKILDPFFSEMILFFETTSKELSEDIWLELLKVFNHAMESKAIGPKEYEKIYKIITQIGNHKVAALNKESICLFIELLDKFQNKSDNKNYNYSCLELLWSLSDNIMNNPLIFKDCDVPKLVLTKLSLSATSSDVQVRNSSLQIFSSLLSDYGQLYSDQLWVESLQSLFFRMFDDILEIYLNLRLQQGLDTNVSSPEAVSNLKSLFDEQKLKSKRDSPENMIQHHTGEKLDNQWEETFINLIQAYAKIAKKYLNKFGGSIGESPHKEISKKIFDYLYFVLKLNSREIFIEAIKGFKTILSSEVSTRLTKSEGLLCEQKALNNIFEQVLKNLSKEDKETEMSKVKQMVIPEVFMMLDQFIDLPKLLAVDCNSDYFFKVFFKLLVYPSINFQDKFKIFLEERYISLIIKKLPNSLRLNGPHFVSHFTKTCQKILTLEPENSMINVITTNFVSKLSEVLTNSKGLGIKFTSDLVGVYQGLKKLAARIHDTNYVTQVKNSKNYKDMVWYSAILCQLPLIEILASGELQEPSVIVELINDLIKASEGLRTSEISTYSMIKADCLKEFTLYILTHPKLLQKAIILASQLDNAVEESLLVEATGEISQFEEYLQSKIFKSYQFDLESKTMVTKYNKNLLETNHRIMAAISSDDQKSCEAYYNLVVRYNKGFEEVIKHSIKAVTKLDENLREETISALNNLTTIKMKEERARVFITVAGLEPKHLEKFGATYCYLPLIMSNLVGLIKIEDQGIREAAAAFLQEYLSA